MTEHKKRYILRDLEESRGLPIQGYLLLHDEVTIGGIWHIHGVTIHQFRLGSHPLHDVAYVNVKGAPGLFPNSTAEISNLNYIFLDLHKARAERDTQNAILEARREEELRVQQVCESLNYGIIE